MPITPLASDPHTHTPHHKLDDQLTNFLDLSNHLLTIIQHENAILAETGELTFEHYIQKKVALMRDFENQAQILLSTIIEDVSGNPRSRLLMDEVKRIRDALTVNSAYQMDTIQKRTRLRQEKFAVKGNDTCH